MSKDEKSTPWMMWLLKLIISIVLTALPTIAVGISLVYIGFVPRLWVGQMMLLSMLVFFVGAGLLLFKKNTI